MGQRDRTKQDVTEWAGQKKTGQKRSCSFLLLILLDNQVRHQGNVKVFSVQDTKCFLLPAHVVFLGPKMSVWLEDHKKLRIWVRLLFYFLERIMYATEQNNHHRNNLKYPPWSFLLSLSLFFFKKKSLPALIHNAGSEFWVKKKKHSILQLVGPERVLWTVAVRSVVVMPEANADN